MVCLLEVLDHMTFVSPVCLPCLQSHMQTNGECKPEQRVRDQLPRSLCKTQHAEQDLACYRFSNDVLSQYSGELVLLHENSAQCTKYCYELAFIVQETHNTGSFCLITYRGNPEDSSKRQLSAFLNILDSNNLSER